MGEKVLIKLVGINGRFIHSCLALFYLREELIRHCPELQLQLYQGTINDNHFETVLQLAEEKPRAILFSALIWNSNFIERLLIDLRQVLPHTNLVVGGPQAEVVGENLRGKIKCTVVNGDIEAMPEKFFTELAAGVPAPYYQGSLLQMTAPRFAFPYRDEDFSGPLANRHVYYESSKGCPFRCSYCLSSVETRVFHKSLAKVKEELRCILRHRPKIVRFIDRTFNDLPERALAIWQFLKEEGGETCFHFEMAPDLFTEKMFTFLQGLPSGRFQFEIGIQSTHKKTLGVIHRKSDMGVITANIKRLAALDTIHIHLDLILGLPYDTQESVAQSFRDVFALGGHYIQMGLLKVLPGTEIAQKASEYGYIWTKAPPYSLLASRWLVHEDLRWFYWFSEVVEKFFNTRNFSSLWRYLYKKKEDMFLFYKGLLNICQRENFFAFAATHKLMSEKILTLCAERDDYNLIVWLLRFDWLRCNHRFIPSCLQDGLLEQPQKTRVVMQRTLPDEMPFLYSRRARNRFFRKSFFLRVPQKIALEFVSAESVSEGVFCFLQEQDGGLYKYNRVVFLQETSKNGWVVKNVLGCAERKHL